MVRTRTDATSSSAGDQQFVSDAARERFHRELSRKVNTERGFLFTNEDDWGVPDVVKRMVEHQGWKKFAAHPSYMVESLVREFYANFEPDNHDWVLVRGRKVSFQTSVLNDFYDLEDDDFLFPDYEATFGPKDYEEFLPRLCYPNTHWEGTRIPKNRLKPIPKLWCDFVQSRLIPTTHCGTITNNRAALVEWMLSDGKFKGGDLLEREIRERTTTPGETLIFPALVTRLCEQSGVPRYRADIRKKIKGVFKRHNIEDISPPRADIPMPMAPPSSSAATAPQHAENSDQIASILAAVANTSTKMDSFCMTLSLVETKVNSFTNEVHVLVQDMAGVKADLKKAQPTTDEGGMQDKARRSKGKELLIKNVEEHEDHDGFWHEATQTISQDTPVPVTTQADDDTREGVNCPTQSPHNVDLQLPRPRFTKRQIAQQRRIVRPVQREPHSYDEVVVTKEHGKRRMSHLSDKQRRKARHQSSPHQY